MPQPTETTNSLEETRPERAITRRMLVSGETPAPEAIQQAAELLRRGGLVAFPTETVYGLGANAFSPEAVARIFAAKGRPAHNPLIVHISDIEDVKAIVSDWPETAAKLAERFWPGPLTLVLPRAGGLPDTVTGGGPTVAVRMPAHPVALALLRAARLPVAAPSANRSTQISPTCAEHVLAGLEGRIEMVLDAGPTPGGIESTVLDLTTSPPRLLRPGLLSPAEIVAVIGPITLPAETFNEQKSLAPERGIGTEVALPAADYSEQKGSRDAPPPPSALARGSGRGEESKDTTPLPSPGMMERHYAPRAPLELRPDSSERVEELLAQGERVGWLTFTGESESPDGLLQISMPREAKAYAARLYAALHALDAASVTRIVVELPPQGNDWLAIHDRLRRAAAPPE